LLVVFISLLPPPLPTAAVVVVAVG
jgi:hypothetical protein